jgi:hypothetical protein
MNAVCVDLPMLGRGTGDANTIKQDAPAPGEQPLRCVWSDVLDGCSCDAHISRAVVEQAWQRELECSGDGEARFFHLVHDGGVWQAYGLADGQVRGVYCPSHNSQRAQRSRAALCDPGDVAYELPLAA